MSDDIIERDALQKRLVGSMKLVETTCQLAGQHDVGAVLETVTSDVCEALSCERASLFLYDEHSNQLYTHVVTELEIGEIRSSIENGITGWVARRRKIANIPNPVSDARWNSSIDRRTGFQTHNILAAPLISPRDDRLVGVLQLLNKHEGRFDEFDEQLIQAFAVHASTALERAQLLEETRRSQMLELDFKLGRQIQTSFLPEKLPEVPKYDIAAWWEPAESVSGDYYDVVRLQDGRIGLIVADVSGHGVGPSLIMASVRAMFHVLARRLSDPAEILSLLSETMAPDLTEGRFITFLMVALDPETHEATFANAGHGPALHFTRSTGEFASLGSTGLPLGFATDHRFENAPTIRLEPGDLLLLATDGAIELKNEQNEMFGRKRLQELTSENRHLPAPELRDLLRESISSFNSEQHPLDDVTLIILERKLDEPTGGDANKPTSDG
jgi:serine phosphatase RsbU (regulator of sigma subunit)